MNLLDAIPSPLGGAARTRRPTSVRVGGAPLAPIELEPRAVPCIIAVAPPGYAPPERMVELLGPAVVRRSRLPASRHTVGDDPVVLVLQLHSREACRILPGLDGGKPSLTRDAAQVVFAAGAQRVSILLVWPPLAESAAATRPRRESWEICDPRAIDACRPMLAELPGTTLLFPDLCVDLDPRRDPDLDDPPVAEAQTYERRMRALVTRTALDWTTHYQVALLDLPPVLRLLADGLLSTLLGSDAALCAWEGSEDAVAAHGWRPASAFVAGIIAARASLRGSSCVGWSATLPPGRYVPRSRAEDLRLYTPRRTGSPVERPVLAVRLSGAEREGTSGTILTEPTLRRPMGAWPLPALFEVKDIHRRLIAAASSFVFEAVDEEVAMALAVSLRRSVRAQVEAGLLVGPSGAGSPDIRGGTLSDPAAPGLVAIIHAQLRPWAQRVSVRVSVRQDAQPLLEVV